MTIISCHVKTVLQRLNNCVRHKIYIFITCQLKCDGTRADTRFCLSAKWKSPFKSVGGRQFSRLLAVEVCASAVVMLDTLCSEVVWRVLATHSIRQFPLHFPSHVSPCAITFQLESTSLMIINGRVHLNRPVGASVQPTAGSRGVRHQRL